MCLPCSCCALKKHVAMQLLGYEETCCSFYLTAESLICWSDVELWVAYVKELYWHWKSVVLQSWEFPSQCWDADSFIYKFPSLLLRCRLFHLEGTKLFYHAVEDWRDLHVEDWRDLQFDYFSFGQSGFGVRTFQCKDWLVHSLLNRWSAFINQIG